MKIGLAMREEREKSRISIAKMAKNLEITEGAYRQIETGESLFETWGVQLGKIAIKLEIPTTRLLARTGKAKDIILETHVELIKQQRDKKKKSISDLSEYLDITEQEYQAIEDGETAIGKIGKQILQFAEAINQPMFNILIRPLQGF